MALRSAALAVAVLLKEAVSGTRARINMESERRASCILP
jgi:hypothetical protein